MTIPQHDIDYQQLVERESSLWGETKARERMSWFDSPIIGRHINHCITGNAHKDWLDYIKEKFYQTPEKLGLNVGCGHGELERHILKRDITEMMEGCDISPKAVEASRQKAGEEGFGDRVRYFTADANFLEHAELAEQYDIIFASMALHHFMELEKCLDILIQHLKPGGLFITNEFIGPDRFQWTDQQLDATNRILNTIPLELRKTLRGDSPYKDQAVRPGLDYMIENFAFEAVCSERIHDALYERFEVIEYKPYGGTILHLLFEAIMNNFDEEHNREHAVIVRTAVEWERSLLDYGALQHDHAFYICQKR